MRARGSLLTGVLTVALLGAGVAPLGMAGCASDDTLSFGDGASSGGGAEPAVVPAAGGIRRLLHRQYLASVGEIFGAAAQAAANPPHDLALHGYGTVGASTLAVPASDIELYEASSRAVAKAVTDDAAGLAALLPCTPSSAGGGTGPGDEACYRAFIEQTGRLVWRRPLLDEEVDDLVTLAVQAASVEGTFAFGVRYAIIALLQSPYFLYIQELGEPDAEVADEGVNILDPYEVASRLSFFLLDRTPSAALLDAAEQGDLDTPEGVRAVARELLSQTAAEEALGSFFGEWLRLADLDTTVKNEALFPEFTPQLAEAMKHSMLLLIRDVAWTRNADARELLTASYAYVDSGLAPIYGVDQPADDFVKVELPEHQGRAGYLGSAAFLSRFSHAAKTSATKRGLFVRRSLMCDVIDPPPPGVDLVLPDDPETPQTMKEKLEVHMEEDECRACHGLIDPPGLALEAFDAIGRFRTEDQGLPIDTSMEVDGIGSFDSARSLSELLVELPQVPRCMVKNLYRHAIGRVEGKGDGVAIVQLHERFTEHEHRLQDLLVELVSHPAFTRVSEPD